jgi:TRAP-type C4-dicarboxylate transport system substrate-binding protein
MLKWKESMLGCLTLLGILIAMALLLVPQTVFGQATTLTFGGSDPLGTVLDLTNKRFTDLVNERAGGKVKINFLRGEQLGNDIQVIEQMMQGSVHLYGDELNWYQNWVKDFAILTWGFTFRDANHVQKFIDSPIFGERADALRTQNGIRILAGAPTQERLLFAKKPVRSAGDLTNIKMRVPEMKSFVKLWEALGTRPTRVAWAEVPLGLKTGVIDAAEGPVSSAYGTKFHEGAKYVMRTRHVIATCQISMNEKAFQALSPEVQKIFVEAAKDATQWGRARAAQETDELIAKMANEGATLVPIDPEPLRQKALGAVEAMEAEGLWQKGLWQRIQGIQ